MLWFVLFGTDKETVVKNQRDIWKLPSVRQSVGWGRVCDFISVWPLD